MFNYTNSDAKIVSHVPRLLVLTKDFRAKNDLTYDKINRSQQKKCARMVFLRVILSTRYLAVSFNKIFELQEC